MIQITDALFFRLFSYFSSTIFSYFGLSCHYSYSFLTQFSSRLKRTQMCILRVLKYICSIYVLICHTYIRILVNWVRFQCWSGSEILVNYRSCCSLNWELVPVPIYQVNEFEARFLMRNRRPDNNLYQYHICKYSWLIIYISSWLVLVRIAYHVISTYGK